MTDNHQTHSHTKDGKEETKEIRAKDTLVGGYDIVYKLPPLMNHLRKPHIVVESWL